MNGRDTVGGGRNGTNNVYTYEKMSKEKKMTLP
jgi:hypothetical protein